MRTSSAATWQIVRAERRQLAADLAGLRADQWSVPSLCPGWDVHDVLAHVVDTARTGRLSFVRDLLRARLDFDRANDNGISRYRRHDPRDTLAALEEAVELTRTPPAALATRLVEAIVHGEDIRRPLGIPGSYPEPAILQALAHQLRTPVSFGGGRERAAGLRLIDRRTGATWGQGADVEADALDLLLAVSGRRVDRESLTGSGASRLSAAATATSVESETASPTGRGSRDTARTRDDRLWALVRAERTALAEDLSTLEPKQWGHETLCGRWDVEQVVAHLTAAASLNRWQWLRSMVGARFRPDVHNERRLTEHRGRTPAETLDRFRAVIGSTTAPSGHTPAYLGEVLVHAQDIRWPLRLRGTPSVEALTPVAEFFARRNFTVAGRTHVAGLHLRADDGPFRTGAGPLVTGSTLALVMSMAGRASYLDHLKGSGVPILRSRLHGAAG
jgi:uncharacterized protein (TIGR03083 family)